MNPLVIACKGGEGQPRGGRLFLARSITLALTADADTAWIQISKLGTWKGHSWGEFSLEPAHFESAIAQFAKQVNELVVDYEHASLSFIPTEAPAAGWISELKTEGDSLNAFAKFTAKAAAYIRAGEYRYLSPVWLFDSPDRESGEPVLAELHSVALTNVPFFDGMAPLELTRLRALTHGESMNPKTKKPAKGPAANNAPGPVPNATPAGETALATLLALTGLATEEELAAWIEANADGIKALVDNAGEGAGEGGEGGGGMPANRQPAPGAAPAAGTDPALALALSRIERLEEQNARYASKEIDDAVNTAIAAGRATPNERESLVELARSNRKLFDKLTASRTVVPTSRVVDPGSARTAGNGAGAPAKTPKEQQAEIDALSESERFAFRNWRAMGKPHDKALELCRSSES